MNAPVGMKTNGEGKPTDWLNRTRSMADDPEIIAAVKLEHGIREAKRIRQERVRPPKGARDNARLRFAGFDPTEVQIKGFSQ